MLAGVWVGDDLCDVISVTNPANGEIVGHVPNIGSAETTCAIVAADIAQKNLPAQERAFILKRWFDID